MVENLFVSVKVVIVVLKANLTFLSSSKNISLLANASYCMPFVKYFLVAS